MKYAKLFSIMLVLTLLFCTAASAQEDMGGPGANTPAHQGPTIFKTIPNIPDGAQPKVSPATGPIKRIMDELPELAAPVYLPVWKQLQDISLTDKKNAYIELEPLQDLTADELEELDDIENLWNTGAFTKAIDILCRIEKSNDIQLGCGVSWIKPRNFGAPDWENDIQVESRGMTVEAHYDFDDGTKNLFTVIRRKAAGDNVRWSVNISNDNGDTWSETYCWSAKNGEVKDVAAVVAGKYLYIAYAPKLASGFYTGMRLKRCLTSNGAIDKGYNFITVFDKGVEIREVSLASNEDYFADRIYLVSILMDNTLVYFWDDYTALSWSEMSTGITNAYESLDTTCNNSLFHFLFVTYRSTSSFLKVASKGISWTVYNMEKMDERTSISAYNNNVLVAYEYLASSGRVIKYQVSNDGGLTWTFGYVGNPASSKNYCPVVAARRGGGFAVIWNQEMGFFDPVWYTHRDYGTSNWSTPMAINETDALSYGQMELEWDFSNSGSDYVALWRSHTSSTTNTFLLDKSQNKVGSLTADTKAISESGGGKVNLSLDAGWHSSKRKYIILGCVSGTSPGFPLPGNIVKMPINWDGFTSGMLPYLNSHIFNNFLGTLDSTGKSSANFNAPGPLPKGMAGAKIHFAFACNKPWNFVSNTVEISVLP